MTECRGEWNRYSFYSDNDDSSATDVETRTLYRHRGALLQRLRRPTSNHWCSNTYSKCHTSSKRCRTPPLSQLSRPWTSAISVIVTQSAVQQEQELHCRAWFVAPVADRYTLPTPSTSKVAEWLHRQHHLNLPIFSMSNSTAPPRNQFREHEERQEIWRRGFLERQRAFQDSMCRKSPAHCIPSVNTRPFLLDGSPNPNARNLVTIQPRTSPAALPCIGILSRTSGVCLP